MHGALKVRRPLRGRHCATAPGWLRVRTADENSDRTGFRKESLSALEVASAIEQGFREIYPDAEYVKLPVADGGEGTVEAMVAATGGLLVPLTVTGPLGEPVEAFYGLSGDRQCAFIEMAAASGLESVPPAQRNPLLTTSGTGSLSAMRWTPG